MKVRCAILGLRNKEKNLVTKMNIIIALDRIAGSKIETSASTVQKRFVVYGTHLNFCFAEISFMPRNVRQSGDLI
ncbi:unnamed protein product [marine sediment metagenome]|uniref:Uncharacterized protein n=1 Tax=marine sediment metagenome TaxID=412755 RepID=X1FRI2_9ZZZZ